MPALIKACACASQWGSMPVRYHGARASTYLKRYLSTPLDKHTEPDCCWGPSASTSVLLSSPFCHHALLPGPQLQHSARHLPLHAQACGAWWDEGARAPWAHQADSRACRTPQQRIPTGENCWGCWPLVLQLVCTFSHWHMNNAHFLLSVTSLSTMHQQPPASHDDLHV